MNRRRFLASLGAAPVAGLAAFRSTPPIAELPKSGVAIARAGRVEPMPAWTPLPPPVWQGDTADSIPPPRELIAQVFGHFPGDDFDWAEWQHSNRERAGRIMRFYSGDEQWTAPEVHERSKRGRPLLTINRLPALVHASKEKGKEHLTPDQLYALAYAVTLQNMDAQRLYNYEFSMLAELECLTVSRFVSRAKGYLFVGGSAGGQWSGSSAQSASA